ncbi:MAG: DUF2461 domain-containing protein [Ignavibacteria bacterium]|nr:DUF2461 domain-containing protein [Ignavibacteria bacterium]
MVYLDDLILQPFPGFSKDTLGFLRKLKSPKNNNKPWFDEHREIYESCVKHPMRLLIVSLSGELKKLDDKIIISNKSIFRINRDIRFKKDKTPYKSHYAAAFTFDVIKRPEIPQFYFHLSPDEFLFAAGQYSMDTRIMDKIKKKIYKKKEEFLKIISDRKIKIDFGVVRGDFYANLPGRYSYAKGEKVLESIFRMKNIYVYRTYPPDIALDSRLTEVIMNDVRNTYKFNKFLFYN